MRYSLHDFYLILDDLFLTAVHPLQDAVRDLGPSFYTFYMSPSLAAVLAWRYRQADLLVAIDAEEGNWRLSSARHPEEQYRLSVDIPPLVSQMYRLIVEDGKPPAAVVDLVVLREQMRDSLRQAYQQRFG